MTKEDLWLDLLPNEVLLHLIQEWIGRSLCLFALDKALCNRLLRTKYLQCLQYISRNSVFVPFKTKTSKLHLLQKWLEQRSVSLQHLSLQYDDPTPFLPFPTLKKITHLSLAFKTSVNSKLDIAWIFNEFPCLRSLKLTYLPDSIEPAFTNFIEETRLDEMGNISLENFGTFTSPVYLLEEFAMHRVDGIIPLTLFEDMITRCPKLHSMKLIDCSKIFLPYISSLLRITSMRGTPLQALYFDGSWNPFPIDSTSFDTLYLHRNFALHNVHPATVHPTTVSDYVTFHHTNHECIEVPKVPSMTNNVLIGLQNTEKQPNKRQLYIDVVEDMNADDTTLFEVLHQFGIVHELAMMNTAQLSLESMKRVLLQEQQWSQLESLCLKECGDWCNDLFIDLLGQCCGKRLHTLELAFLSTVFTNRSCQSIATKFPALTTLSLVEINNLTDEGIAYFYTSTPSFARQLYSLTLIDIAIEQRDTLSQLFAACENVKHLYLGSIHEGIQLKEILQTYPYRERLLCLGLESHEHDESEIPWEQFVALQSISLQEVCFSHKELKKVLTLPALVNLSIGVIHAINHISPSTVFYRQTYKHSHLKFIDFSRMQQINHNVIFTHQMLKNIFEGCKQLTTFRIKQSCIQDMKKFQKLQRQMNVYYRMEDVLCLDEENDADVDFDDFIIIEQPFDHVVDI